jgi:hypothetical protein
LLVASWTRAVVCFPDSACCTISCAVSCDRLMSSWSLRACDIHPSTSEAASRERVRISFYASQLALIVHASRDNILWCPPAPCSAPPTAWAELWQVPQPRPHVLTGEMSHARPTEGWHPPALVRRPVMSLASRNVAHLHLIVETKESRIVLQRRGSERARSAGGPSVQASLHPTMRRKHSSAPTNQTTAHAFSDPRSWTVCLALTSHVITRGGGKSPTEAASRHYSQRCRDIPPQLYSIC